VRSGAKFPDMRICSLLPSATEILFALGLGDQVVGVSHECDFPPMARKKTVLIRPRVPLGGDAAEIDRQVREFIARGESIYEVNLDALAALDPDLIVTQDLCQVCAPTPDDVRSALARLPRQPRVVSLDPHLLDEVCADIRTVGEATGRVAQAERLVGEFHSSVAQVERAVSGQPRRRVVCLEWLDPPYIAGHWVPEMVARAGGIDALGRQGRPSFRAGWEEIVGARPEVMVIMPCGYNVDQATREFQKLSLPSGWDQMPAVQSNFVFLVDASAYFSRPGPRLAAGLAILANAIHAARQLGLPPHGPQLMARASAGS
jgi:iron complex transport system substrate-binding protein